MNHLEKFGDVMNGSQYYRLTQEIAAVTLSRAGRPLFTQLHAGTIITVSALPQSELGPQMVEIVSDGRNYALFASDLEDRTEPVAED